MSKVRETGSRTEQRASARFTKRGLTLILALVVALFLVITFTATPPESASVAQQPSPKRAAPSPAGSVAKKDGHPAAHAKIDPGAPMVPKQIEISRKVLVNKKWNSGPDAFGMKGPDKGEEGGIWGPASVASINGELYVMDNVHGRLLRYDKDGHMLGLVPLSNPSICGDLVPNPTDNSLWVIDSDFNTIYKVKGGEVVATHSVPTRNLTDRLLWGYDAATDTVFCTDPEKGDLPILRNGQVLSQSERTPQHLSAISPEMDGPENLVLGLRDGHSVRVAFGQRMECVEQIVTDGQGIIWMLYNLTGDFRMRRLARIDPTNHTVGVTTLKDVWFAVDGTRHLAATSSGVVLFVGGENEGTLLAFDYAGGAL
jgi:hypothetical protein